MEEFWVTDESGSRVGQLQLFNPTVIDKINELSQNGALGWGINAETNELREFYLVIENKRQNCRRR